MNTLKNCPVHNDGVVGSLGFFVTQGCNNGYYRGMFTLRDTNSGEAVSVYFSICFVSKVPDQRELSVYLDEGFSRPVLEAIIRHHPYVPKFGSTEPVADNGCQPAAWSSFEKEAFRIIYSIVQSSLRVFIIPMERKWPDGSAYETGFTSSDIANLEKVLGMSMSSVINTIRLLFP